MTTPTVTEPSPAIQKPMRAARWILLAIALGLIVGVVLWMRRAKQVSSAQSAAASASAEARPVPVVVTRVLQADVPIYLEGLGTVTPLNTVSVRSQIDGRLDSVAFKEGQTVKRGDLLAQIDPRPFVIQLHTAQAAVARDAATLRNAKLNLDRYKSLRQQNLIPQQQVDDQQTLVDQTEAAVAADAAQADTAKLQLDYARIVSPLEGVTGVRQVDPGNIVHASDPTGIVLLTQLDPISVIFTLPEDDLIRVARQLAKEPLNVDAYSRDGSTKLASGSLLLIDNQINQATATIRLKALFDNPDRSLWPNEFVKTRLLLRVQTGALEVPATVVQRGPQGTFAYVVGADNTVSMRTIEVESTQGEEAIIAKGLEAGEAVVSDGQAQLKPGSKIAPRGDPKGAPSAAVSPSASASWSTASGGPQAPHAAPPGGRPGRVAP